MLPVSKAPQQALLTDLYELTMAQSYFQHGMYAPAAFSLFIRRYPKDRAYFVSAGLEDVLRLPGEKQVHRFLDGDGDVSHDVIALRYERLTSAEPLLRRVMKGGRIVEPPPSLADIRQTFTEEFSRLPREYKALRNPSAFPVEMSRELQGLYHQMEERRSVKKVPTTAKGRQSNKG